MRITKRESGSRAPRHLTIAAVGATLGIVGLAAAETIPASAAGEAHVITETPALRVVETLATHNTAASSAAELPIEEISADSEQTAIDALETRLAWAGSFAGTPDGTWTAATTAAVRSFQVKQGLKTTSDARPGTIKKLNEVANSPELDARCYASGIRICVSKAQKVVRYLRNGDVLREFDVNIGPEPGDPKYGQYSSTREGVNTIGEKNVDAVSNLYGYEMPYWMQFDGGIGFHYSKYFDEAGYADTSMGCVTIGSEADAKWLFNQTPLHTKVIVY